MLDITAGTKETVLVDVTDTLGNLTSLAGATPRYDVKDHAGNYKLQNLTPTVDPLEPLTAQCLIDTTVGGVWTPGRYKLYLRFLDSPDSPVMGPLEFKVNP